MSKYTQYPSYGQRKTYPRDQKWAWRDPNHPSFCSRTPLSRLTGTTSHPVMQNFRIIGFFFGNSLNWQFAVQLLPASKPFDHSQWRTEGAGGSNLPALKFWHLLSVLNWICWTPSKKFLAWPPPPPKKFLGTPLIIPDLKCCKPYHCTLLDPIAGNFKAS
jgi:hypothetical protein